MSVNNVWEVTVMSVDRSVARNFVIIDGGGLTFDEFGLYLEKQFGKERVVGYRRMNCDEES